MLDRNSGTLIIHCTVLYGKHGFFRIDVRNEATQEFRSACGEAGTDHLFQLTPGRYSVRVSSCPILNPGGINNWITVMPGETRRMEFRFAPQLRYPFSPLVSVTLRDAVYPGITPLNGGITVWRQLIIP